jgi:hypothetical protein
MADKCDICGFNYGPNDHYCGGCNVDLREPRGPETLTIRKKSARTENTTKDTAKKKDLKDEGVLHWHTIKALCGREISFPHFFYVMMVLGEGEKQLGFCDCTSCNMGYREMLTAVVNATENKELTPHSREIVIKAREVTPDGAKFDIAKMIRKDDEKKETKDSQNMQDAIPRRSNSGKIVIEIDPGILEDAIFTILKSEKGQEIIRSIPKKRGRPKKS